MIDGDDVDDAWILALLTEGWLFWVAIIALCVVFYYYKQNTTECEQKYCPENMHAKIVDHECICVKSAK